MSKFGGGMRRVWGILRRIFAALAILPAAFATVWGMAWAAEPVVEPNGYDVVIYGGTSAAITAAEQVRIMGKTVVIVSPDVHLGGLSSGGLGATDSGNRTVIGGLSRDFYHRLWRYYQNESAWIQQPMPSENGIPGQGGRGIDNATETMWVFEPHTAEATFEQIVAEFEIPVFRGEWLDRENGVKKNGPAIESMTTLSGKTFCGKRFIDATYEGDLMAAAGCSYTIGRESNAQYGETLNGIQTANAIYHQFAGFVDPYVERGNPKSGLLPGVHEKINGPDGTGDLFVQAYNLRMCLTNAPENRLKFEKPDSYDPLQYEILIRSIEAGQKDFTTFSPMPNFKTDSNNNFAVSTDFIGQNYDYPDGSYARRREIYDAHLNWHKGLFWTLANDERVPEIIRKTFNEWGLAKDEFTDHGGWSHQMYIREARRLVGDFVVTERHLRRELETKRPVGMGSYNMDSHHIQRYVAELPDGRKTVLNEGDVQVSPGGPYPIDYGALLPKKTECDNLLVPVAVSCTHIAYGSIRMEPVFMILGQSAATAACLSLDAQCAPADLPYETLKERLIVDRQALETDSAILDHPISSLPGIVMDDETARKTGAWQSGTVSPSFAGFGYLHDGDNRSGTFSVVYELTVPQSGAYEVRVSYPPHANRATNVPVTVETALGQFTAFVNQKEKPPIDGLFVSIGTAQIGVDKKCCVVISNQGTDGYTIADAVQLILK